MLAAGNLRRDEVQRICGLGFGSGDLCVPRTNGDLTPAKPISRRTTSQQTNRCGCVKATESTNLLLHHTYHILYTTANLAGLVRAYGFTSLSHRW